MLEWAYIGVNITVAGNGGVECTQFLSMKTRIIETIFVMSLTYPLMRWGFKNLSPLNVDCNPVIEPTGKRVLLVLMSLIWGIEIGFKFSSKTVIFLLNPCHVTTAMQIYLLAASPSKWVAVIFRFHLNCMNGAILALTFPELDALNLPFETWIYWIQHTLMLIIPLYLLQQGGVFEVEELCDLSWCAVSYGVLLIYHFLLLQPLGIRRRYESWTWLMSSPLCMINVCELLQDIWTKTLTRVHLLFDYLRYCNADNRTEGGHVLVSENVIQEINKPAQVNLNHMLCPAVRDPFRGPYYRMYAICHQAILCPLMCKSLCALADCWKQKPKKIHSH